MKSTDFLSTLLLGTGIGVAVGILLAPAKGYDTLKKVSDVIKDKFNQYKGEAENATRKLGNEGKNLMDKGANQAKKYLQDGEEKLEDLKANFNTPHNS